MSLVLQVVLTLSSNVLTPRLSLIHICGKIKSAAGETEISETAVFTKMLEVNQSFGYIEIDVPRDPDKIKFIISSETPLDEKSTGDSYLLALARSTDGKAEYSVNVKNGELSVKNSDD